MYVERTTLDARAGPLTAAVNIQWLLRVIVLPLFRVWTRVNSGAIRKWHHTVFTPLFCLIISQDVSSLHRKILMKELLAQTCLVSISINTVCHAYCTKNYDESTVSRITWDGPLLTVNDMWCCLEVLMRVCHTVRLGRRSARSSRVSVSVDGITP